MTDSAALLADEVPPPKPLRQWVLSLPFALRFLLATDPEALTRVLGVATSAPLGLRAAAYAASKTHRLYLWSSRAILPWLPT
jgi:hypothetical protein